MNDRPHGVDAPVSSLKGLRLWTALLRRQAGLGMIDRFPVLPFLELTMPRLVDGFDLEIVEWMEVREEARAFPEGTPQHPQGPVIQLLGSVYEAAYDGQGRARMTLLRQCGQVLLGTSQGIRDAARPGRALDAHIMAGWKANEFADELLMPVESFTGTGGIDDFSKRMGVSPQAALARGAQLLRSQAVSSLPWTSQTVPLRTTEHGGSTMRSP